MSFFVVRFLKNVIGDGGQTSEACQGAFDADTPSKDEAARLAMEKFSAQYDTLDWTLYADRMEVKPADYHHSSCASGWSLRA